MLTRIEVIKQINDFEQKYEVDKWLVDGVKVWPFIRIKLGLHLYYNKDVQKISFSQKKNKKASKIFFLKKYINILVAVIPFLKFLLLRSDYFFAGFFHYRTKLNEKWTNRFFDVLVNLLRKNNYHSVIVEVSPRVNFNFFNGNRLFFSEEIKEIFYHLPNTDKIKGETELNGYDGFINDLQNEESTKGLPILSVEQLTKAVRRVFWEANFYYFLLSLKKPKYIFQINYYSTQMMGLNIAAHKLNIPVVDIQHGGQGPLHMAYGNWSKVPIEGYEMLPKYFWNWSEYDASAINEWAKKTTCHKAIHLGNPWLDSFRNNDILTDILKIDGNDYDDNVILFSLQSKKIEIPDFAIKAIVETKDRYKWRFRVHPTHSLVVNEIKKQLDDIGLKGCYEIEKTSSLPLPLVLAKTLLHITEFSGVTKEASDLGIFSIMLHPYSRELFANEIELGNTLYIENITKEEFLDLMAEKIKENTTIIKSEKFNFYEKVKLNFVIPNRLQECQNRRYNTN